MGNEKENIETRNDKRSVKKRKRKNNIIYLSVIKYKIFK